MSHLAESGVRDDDSRLEYVYYTCPVSRGDWMQLIDKVNQGRSVIPRKYNQGRSVAPHK